MASIRAVGSVGLGSIAVNGRETSDKLDLLLQQPAMAFDKCLAASEQAIYRAMDEDEDTHFCTCAVPEATTSYQTPAQLPSSQGRQGEAWGCTKSGITENMAYVWAENEAALRVFEPLAKAVCDMIWPCSKDGEQCLRLFAASFIVARPPGLLLHP